MRRSSNLYALLLALVLAVPPLTFGEEKPLWKIDLSPFGYNPPVNEVVLRFSGRLLVIYLGQQHSRFVFDKETHQQVPEDRLAGVALPPPIDFAAGFGRKPFPAVNIIKRWKQMSIEEIGGIGLGQVPDAEFYLQEPGRPKVLLSRGGPRCTPGDPEFVGDHYILLFPCSGKNVVVDKQGRKVYELPNLSNPYVAPNLEGTRFATYERDASFFHSFEGTTNKLRVKVFHSSDGKKLFEYRWNVSDDEGISDGRVALSDDGSQVALVRGHEILIFPVPPQE